MDERRVIHVKFGGSLMRRNWNIYQQLFKGRMQFNSSQTNSTGTTTGTGGNSFASLLAGQAISENYHDFPDVSPISRLGNWRIRSG